MLKQKNKQAYENWMNERIAKGHTFSYEKGVLFGYECKTAVKCIETGDSFKFEYSEPKSNLRFPPETVKQVWIDMIKKESWFKSRGKKKSDSTCSNCKRSYEHIDSDIALMFIPGKLNKHVCKECGEKYISLGAEDIKKKKDEIKAKKNDLIEKIRALGNYNENGVYSRKLDELEIDKLTEIYDQKKAEKEESDRIAAIVLPETETEEYLIKDYGVVENNKWLKCEEQIEDYFKDTGYDLFDCGQGYYDDDVNVICKIGDKFYDVKITAEIGSAKQDRGDRLYWVEKIEKVEWQEIDKPLPKEKHVFNYSLTLNADQRSEFDAYLKKTGFEYKQA